MELVGNISEKVKSFSLLCAAMVVGIHVADQQELGTAMWWLSRIGHYGVFLIAVPFFFTASGYFLAKHCSEAGWWCRECRKRVRSLLVPYLVWSAVAVLLTIGMIAGANMVHGRELLQNIPCSWKWWARAFGINPFCYPGMVPLWYLRTLMIFVFVSPLLYIAVKRGGAKILLIIYVASCAVGLFAYGHLYLFMRYTFQLNGMFYFVLGMIVRLRGYDVEMKSWIMPFISLLFGIVVLGYSICSFEVGTRTFEVVRLIFVPLFLFALWNLLPLVKLPQWLTSTAFPIFLLHTLVWRFLGAVSCATKTHIFAFLDPDGLCQWAIKWMVGFCGSLMLAVCMRKMFPKVAAIAFGGR